MNGDDVLWESGREDGLTKTKLRPVLGNLPRGLGRRAIQYWGSNFSWIDPGYRREMCVLHLRPVSPSDASETSGVTGPEVRV